MKRSLEDDGRLAEVARLSSREQALATEAVEVREALAALVTAMLPPHAPEVHVVEVVEATGYSHTLIEGLRGGKHPWHAPPNREYLPPHRTRPPPAVGADLDRGRA